MSDSALDGPSMTRFKSIWWTTHFLILMLSGIGACNGKAAYGDLQFGDSPGQLDKKIGEAGKYSAERGEWEIKWVLKDRDPYYYSAFGTVEAGAYTINVRFKALTCEELLRSLKEKYGSAPTETKNVGKYDTWQDFIWTNGDVKIQLHCYADTSETETEVRYTNTLLRQRAETARKGPSVEDIRKGL
jgi:hypothetical protein